VGGAFPLSGGGVLFAWFSGAVCLLEAEVVFAFSFC